MNIYESSEDYLERILMLQEKGMTVRSIDLAESFKYSRASVSRAIKNLKLNGYLEVASNGTIILTEEGTKIAKKMLERHNLLTKFFISIGVPEDIAYQDACKIEHDLTDETFNAIIKHSTKSNK